MRVFDQQFFLELTQSFAAVCTEPVTETIQLANIPVRLYFASPALHQLYFTGLQHLTCSSEQYDQADIFALYVFDLAGNVDVDRFAKQLFVQAQNKIALKDQTDGHFASLGECAYYYNDVLNFGFWVTNDYLSLSSWHYANPLRFFWYDWLAKKNRQISHMAAVGDEKQAILLAGISGAGKSSTAIACLKAGLTLLGDDHCIFGLSEHPQIFSLYHLAKLKADMLNVFPECQSRIVGYIGAESEKKALLSMNSGNFSNHGRRIKAIVKLDGFVSGQCPQIKKALRQEILKTLALSTIEQAPKITIKKSLEHHQKLVEAVDCFSLKLCENFEKNVHLFKSILSNETFG